MSDRRAAVSAPSPDVGAVIVENKVIDVSGAATDFSRERELANVLAPVHPVAPSFNLLVRRVEDVEFTGVLLANDARDGPVTGRYRITLAWST